MEDKKEEKGNEYKFPVNIFHPVLQKLIHEAKASCNFPESYMGASMLLALSTAIGNTCTLRIKNNRVERPVIFLHLVGEPGSVKSHPLRSALQPIIDRDVQKRLDYQSQYDTYQQELKEGGHPDKPTCSQRFVQDATPEALVKIIAANPAGVCNYCDEVSLFFKNLNRYSKGGFDSMMLSLFDCLPIFMDRSGTDVKVTIVNPFANIAGTIQPDVFVKLYKGHLTENGFLHRIMAVYSDGPDELPYDSELEIPTELQEKWSDVINSILKLEDGFKEFATPAEYTLSEKAKGIYSTWSRNTTDRVNMVEPQEMRGFFQKIKSYVYRVALILQVAKEAVERTPSKLVIEEETMVWATVYGNFMLQSARKTIDLFDGAPAYNRKAYRDLLAFLPDSFTKTLANEIAATVGISESTVDKFCKDQQGKSIVKVGRGQYQKIVK